MIEDYHLKVEDIEQRVKTVRIPKELVTGILTHGIMLECVEGIPEKSVILGVHYDTYRREFFAIVRNLEFDVVPTGTIPPELTVKIKTYLGPELKVMRKIITDVRGVPNDS